MKGSSLVESKTASTVEQVYLEGGDRKNEALVTDEKSSKSVIDGQSVSYYTLYYMMFASMAVRLPIVLRLGIKEEPGFTVKEAGKNFSLAKYTPEKMVEIEDNMPQD